MILDEVVPNDRVVDPHLALRSEGARFQCDVRAQWHPAGLQIQQLVVRDLVRGEEDLGASLCQVVVGTLLEDLSEQLPELFFPRLPALVTLCHVGQAESPVLDDFKDVHAVELAASRIKWHRNKIEVIHIVEFAPLVLVLRGPDALAGFHSLLILLHVVDDSSVAVLFICAADLGTLEFAIDGLVRDVAIGSGFDEAGYPRQTFVLPIEAVPLVA